MTGSLACAEHAVVDALVVGRRFGDARERTAGHHDQAAAGLLDRRHLLLVAADHLVDRAHAGGIEMVGAAAREDQRRAAVARLPGLAGFHRAADQLERGRPVEAHAALRGVHRLGDAHPQVPEVFAIRDGLVPIDRAIDPGIVGGARIGDHVGCREGDAVEGSLGLVGVGAGLGQDEGLELAGVGREIDFQGGEDRCVHLCRCPSSCVGWVKRSADPTLSCTLPLRWVIAHARPNLQIKLSTPARRSSGAPSSCAARIPPAARPWRLRAGPTCRARLPRRGG